MIGYDVIAMIVFFSLVALHFFFRRKKIKFSGPIVLEYWNKGLDKIDSFVKKHRKFISYLEILSVGVGFVLMFVGLFFIGYSLIKSKQTLALVLPSVSGVKYPGPIVSIPFWYWLIAIFLIVFPHETSHAIFARAEKIRIKNYGILYLLLLPMGAFVEPDEKQMKKSNWMEKIKIYSAGSFANLIVAAIAIGLMFSFNFLMTHVIHPSGLLYTPIKNTPAYYSKLEGRLIGINNYTINDVNDLINAMNNFSPGQKVTLVTTKGNYSIVLENKTGKPFIGIGNITTYYTYSNGKPVNQNIIMVIMYFMNLLNWLFVLSVGVSIANMLPAKYLDGGLVVEEIFKHFLGNKKGKKVSNFVGVLTWILVIFSIFGVWLINKII